ncbi:hypothetical protein HYALB_00013338 [Hymenoscyphus albidus]|uniref:Phospholipid metabolism enzyme regulator n=1 Tax=Hymenoscyphus albidus TaxID=595503 RepID=A0A9N9QBQ5_9HELO|nr:hypothetical protein HYALB_00013338 [Hymenoscyphus albidus]
MPFDNRASPSTSATVWTHDSADIPSISSVSAASSGSGSTTPSRSTTPKPRESSISTSTTPSAPPTRKIHPKRALSSTSTPIPSRDPSPVRQAVRPSVSTRHTGPGRSRKNSSQDVSPSRSSSTTNPPSAAATQRALSAASIPTLYPNLSEPIIRAPIPQKPSVTSELTDTPRWPISPRLRSPPLNKSTATTPRKIDQEPPVINVQRADQPTDQSSEKPTSNDNDAEDSLTVPGMRTPARGPSGASGVGSTLETVQEMQSKSEDESLERVGRPTDQDGAIKSSKQKANATASESGSESGGKGEIKMRTTSATAATGLRPSAPAVKPFGTTGGANKVKTAGEGSTRNMTVETEVVSSVVPQVAIERPAGNGSIRQKPSTETIRPKKEKKKTTRKAPSVTSGTGEHANSSRPRLHHHPSIRDFSYSAATAARPSERVYGQGPYSPSSSSGATSPERQFIPSNRRPSLTSSKADIFEAKVASAVDEANSSDSEETFVYESNPPEPPEQKRRYHSRTPSATSMVSQIDHQRLGPRLNPEGVHSVAMKKSMKFANSFNANGPDSTTGEDDGKGTVRSNMGTGRGTTHHHHHIGRWGRNGGNGHASLFDNESPFPNAAKSKFAGTSPRHASQPTSPRLSNASRLGAGGLGKKSSPMSAGYDLDDAADDERTPLIASIRSGRSGRGRRPNAASIRQLEHQASRHNRSLLAQFTGWLVLCLMIILVLSGAVGFMLATTQPLTSVKVLAIKNVLASEQDIIFDMKVQARNPNIVAVTVDLADLVIFAKSKYAGTDSEWWSQPDPDIFRKMRRGIRKIVTKRDDDPRDPPLGEDPNTNPNLEIGHVYELDSPLNFEGSPFQQTHSDSTGQIRVHHPGNNTLPAGSERWGRVLQHEFDLIVRGTLKYSLPLSSRIRSISIEGRVTVKPNAADTDPDTVHITSSR